MKKLCAASAAVLLAACQSTIPQEPLRATAALQPTKGSKAFGEATFEEVDGRVRVIVFTRGRRLQFGRRHERRRPFQPARQAPRPAFHR